MENTLIIGHSQVRYFKEYVTVDKTKSLCFSGCKVNDLLGFDAVRKEVAAASVIVVLCGTNDIPTSRVSDLLEGFEKLFYGIKDVNPTAHVVISSILPRVPSKRQTGTHDTYDEHRDITGKINVVNAALRRAQYITKDLTFMDHPQFVRNNGSINTKLLALDGLHLSFEGTETVVRNIESIVKEVRETQSVTTGNTTHVSPISKPHPTPTPTHSVHVPCVTRVSPTSNPTHSVHVPCVTCVSPTSNPHPTPTHSVHVPCVTRVSPTSNPHPTPIHSVHVPCVTRVSPTFNPHPTPTPTHSVHVPCVTRVSPTSNAHPTQTHSVHVPCVTRVSPTSNPHPTPNNHSFGFTVLEF